MTHLLLTGFEPFGGDTVNPSEGVARELSGVVLHGLTVRAVLLPVDTVRAPEVLREVLADRPAAALLTGLAAGRPQPSLERVALNVLDFRLPDNAGVTRRDDPVVAGGPDAYLSTLPLRRVLSAWRSAGVAGYLSDTAGLYLCNQTMYLARHLLGGGVPCGFLHLPANESLALAARTPTPYLPQAELVRAVRIALETVAAEVAEQTAVR